jgi:hypothetical protein
MTRTWMSESRIRGNGWRVAARRAVVATAVAAAVIAGASDRARAAVPGTVAFAGRLSNEDGPVDGEVSLTFRLYDAEMGGNERWSESHEATADQGLVTIELGSDEPLDDAIFDGSALYLEVSVDGEILTPRSPVGSVPYAIRAAVAERVGPYTPAELQLRVGGTCASGSAMVGVNADGSVACEVDDDTIYAEGDGISIAGNTVSADTTYLQRRILGTCAANQHMVGAGPTGTPTCTADADTTYSAGGGLQLSVANQFSIASGGVTTARIGDDQVTGAKLASSAFGEGLELSGTTVRIKEPVSFVVSSSDTSDTATARLCALTAVNVNSQCFASFVAATNAWTMTWLSGGSCTFTCIPE